MLVFEDIKNNKSDVQTRSCKKQDQRKKSIKLGKIDQIIIIHNCGIKNFDFFLFVF